MKEIKQCNTSTEINLTQDDIEAAMKKSEIPIEAKEALHFFSAVFESTPSANIISFNVLCSEYLQNEIQMEKKLQLMWLSQDNRVKVPDKNIISRIFSRVLPE